MPSQPVYNTRVSSPNSATNMQQMQSQEKKEKFTESQNIHDEEGSEDLVFTRLINTLKRFVRTEDKGTHRVRIDSLPVLPYKQPVRPEAGPCEVEVFIDLEDENDLLDLEIENYSGVPVNVMVEPADP